MRFKRINTWAVSILLVALFTIVVLFPYISDNDELYKIVLFTSIGIVFFMVVLLVGMHIYTVLHTKKRVTD